MRRSLSVCMFVCVSRGRERFICTSISPSTLAVALWRLQSPRLHLPTNYSRLQHSRARAALDCIANCQQGVAWRTHQESQLDSLSLNPSARQVPLAAILFLNVLFTALSASKIAQSSAPPKIKASKLQPGKRRCSSATSRQQGGREVRGQNKIM